MWSKVLRGYFTDERDDGPEPQGVLVTPGKKAVHYFKKFILSSSLAGVGLEAQKKRRSDLSFYDADDSVESSREPDKSEEEKELEKQIGKIREEVWIWYDHVKGYREKVVEVVVTSKQHTEESDAEDPSQGSNARRPHGMTEEFSRTCEICGDRNKD